jgi:ATPase subunit of ABC transporter with duplicated ATPase domains
MLTVSHDAYFLRAVANRVIVLDGKGGWYAYEEPFAAYEAAGKRRPRSEGEQRREDAYRCAELERAALMAKETLDDSDKARIEVLTGFLQALQ